VCVRVCVCVCAWNKACLLKQASLVHQVDVDHYWSWGTALGAYREGHLISWTADSDVTVPSQDESVFM